MRSLFSPKRVAPLATTRESPLTATKMQRSQRINQSISLWLGWGCGRKDKQGQRQGRGAEEGKALLGLPPHQAPLGDDSQVAATLPNDPTKPRAC